ncbi:MAG TPA: 16S rRNA (cytidine(1402)-2'-O)-methyltransferase [Planctomycetota bacterium]|nr:16S rRNA (cytidine(1402)-2'-O)-methyltransferase [Planctomycetota bacterium]
MLYLVATPIGNLSDISQRAIDTLRAVDLIAAEDTRKTGLLLQHLAISAKMKSYHEHNEERSAEELLPHLLRGEKVALVTDGGTPCISDPGYRIVRKCIEHGIPVVSIPGPAAFVSALVVSGLPTHEFHFFGFPPRKPGQRRNRLAEMASLPGTLIFYESPFRVAALLHDCLETLGDRRACIVREITKMFEETTRGTVSELIAGLSAKHPKGEFVVLIEGLNRQ